MAQMKSTRQPKLNYLRYSNMIKQIFLFCALALCMSSCCKKEVVKQDLCAEPTIESSSCTTDSNRIKIAILGKWNWTQTISEAWVVYKANPCTDTVNRSYEFLMNGTIKYSENGNYKSTGTYSFQSGSIYAHDMPLTFELSGWVSICDNYLIIDNSPVDGPKEILLRAN